jgi:2-dehydropantoate 2-reductase
MRILVVGAGGIGGYFGGRLAQAGRAVTFLVRPRRRDEIQARGLEIVSPHGDLTLHPAMITADRIARSFDLILLGVKSYSLEGAIEDFAPAVGAETVIVPGLNGMRHVEILIRRFGAHAVLGGVCRVSTEVQTDGKIRQLADFQSWSYGELDGSRSTRIEHVDAAMGGAGFAASISEDIVGEMWQKWVLLATLGSINCLLRGAIGQIAAVAGGSSVCLSILHECAAIAKACGQPQGDAFIAQQEKTLTTPGSPLTSSMYRDLKKGLPVEADAIVGDLLARGKEQGVETPLLAAAYVNLSIYQQERALVASSQGELRR